MGKRNETAGRSGILGAYLHFLRTYRMSGLMPVFAAITLLGILVILGGTKAGLLIYALF